MSTVNYRNLEQIREEDTRGRRTTLMSMSLLAVGCSAVVIAFVVGANSRGQARENPQDPLAELALRAKADGAPADRLHGKLGFPSVLSDAPKPTTALAAVKDDHGRLIVEPAASTQPQPVIPPSEASGLASAPLPAGDLLRATTVTTQPKDELTRLAASLSKPESSTMADEGHDGGYQIQVASFRSAEDAQTFVEDLRRRGHKAYKQAAYVPDRGLWHRVRIGPFKTKYDATLYKAQLERKEKIAGFVVDPEHQKRVLSDRESGLSNRERKKTEKTGT
ncbi:MAG: SPOR domain-containing protein [Polyangiaceae bacterium]